VQIVADDRLLPKKKLAYSVVMIPGSVLKPAKKEKRLHSANKLPCIDRQSNDKP
jgi:hypothetical protein